MTENEFKMVGKDIESSFNAIADVLYKTIDDYIKIAEEILKNDKLPKEGIAYSEGLIRGFKESREMIERMQSAIVSTCNSEFLGDLFKVLAGKGASVKRDEEDGLRRTRVSEEERLPDYILDTLKKEIGYCLLRIDELKRQGGGQFFIPIYEDQIIKMQKVLDDNKDELKDDQKT